MRSSTDQQRAAIKAGFRHALKAACGGDSFCHATRVSAAQLSRYGSPEYPDFPPADVILDLDLDLGEPSVLAALARLAGCRLTPEAGEMAPADMVGRAMDELRALFARLGKTVLIVTHDLAEAAHLADEIVLMRDGRMLGTPYAYRDERNLPAVDAAHHDLDANPRL